MTAAEYPLLCAAQTPALGVVLRIPNPGVTNTCVMEIFCIPLADQISEDAKSKHWSVTHFPRHQNYWRDETFEVTRVDARWIDTGAFSHTPHQHIVHALRII